MKADIAGKLEKDKKKLQEKEDQNNYIIEVIFKNQKEIIKIFKLTSFKFLGDAKRS